MKYELGKSYLLPVKEILVENKRKFYKVEDQNGCEHNILLFDFQKDDERPQNIACIVKDMQGTQPLFVQDTQPLLMRLYKEKEVYPFWVKSDYSNRMNPYYEISDWNGFTFKLPATGLEKLNLRQRIECRVRNIIEGRIFLEFINKESRILSLPFLSIEEIFENIDVNGKIAWWFKRLFNKNRFFKEMKDAYDSDNEEWIVGTIELLDKNINQWATSKKGRVLLELYRRVCIYLLEDSDILSYCSYNERNKYQSMLSAAAQQADIFIEAIDMLRDNRHIRQIDIMLTKMRKSGFLYESDRKLKVMMCLFMLDKQLMETKMTIIFDIIIDGNKDNWMREPFRSSFVEMLDLFIAQSKKRIDRISAVKTPEEGRELKKIITALAIQLLLMNEKDYIDRQLSRAMFYRYLTYVGGSKSDVLLEKAFKCLTEVEQNKLEYSWNEVSDLTMLALRISSSLISDERKTTFMQSYNGKNSRLQILDGNIEIHPIDTKVRKNKVLPENMLPWHNIQIYLNGQVPVIKEKKNPELISYQKFWKEVENGVLNGNDSFIPNQKKNKKLKPEIGDEVTVRILQQDWEDPTHFNFMIEDPAYCGEGRLCIRNIVRYNIAVDESPFRDNEGRPYLFKAKVLSQAADGSYNFIVTDLMNKYIREGIYVGDEVECMVTDVNSNGCLCVSEYGYSVSVPFTEDFDSAKPGDYIKVQIENVRSTGTIEGVCLYGIMQNFTLNEAFENLIMSYADEKVYEVSKVEKEEVQQQEVMMDYAYVCELINVIDRKAVLDKDYITTYNYLAFARLLTLLVKNTESAFYYSERMRLIQMLQHFVINGSVERLKLDELKSNYGMIIDNYPILQGKLHQLQVVACMDIPENDGIVWNLMSETEDNQLIRLCRLVLGYNSLKGFNLHNERESIKKKINEELQMQIDIEEPMYFGEENQHREFKTSVVYPSNNGMRADVTKQTREILEVICGFLNAEGGILYIGVNNEGVASGLENDLSFFESKDKFDLHIRNNIVYKLGVDANSRIRVFGKEKNGKYVYAIEIQPSERPVELEGTFYQRQGTSTWPLLGDALELFKNRRTEEVREILSRRNGVSVEFMQHEQNVPLFDTEVAPVQVAGEVEEAKQPQVKDVLEVKTEQYQIATSAIRENPIESWQENFGVDLLCFLHFLPKSKYMVTDDELWAEKELSLCVRNDDDYVVLAYENGNVVKVPVSHIMDKRRGVEYARLNEKVLFACPAKKSQLFYSEILNDNGETLMRVDDIANIKEGRINEGGEKLSTIEDYRITRCDVLDGKYRTDLRKVCNLKPTLLGHNINSSWCKDERAIIYRLIDQQ